MVVLENVFLFFREQDGMGSGLFFCTLQCTCGRSVHSAGVVLQGRGGGDLGPGSGSVAKV